MTPKGSQAVPAGFTDLILEKPNMLFWLSDTVSISLRGLGWDEQVFGHGASAPLEPPHIPYVESAERELREYVESILAGGEKSPKLGGCDVCTA